MAKQLFKPALLISALAALCFLWSCSNDDDVNTGIDVSNLTQAVSSPRGTTINITFDVAASGGVQSVTATAEGQTSNPVTVVDNGTSSNVSFDYTVPGTATLGQTFAIDFTVTENSG